MKILTKAVITADWHIGVESDSFIEENGYARSINETMKQIDTVIDYASDKDIPVFVLGDIFEDKNPIAKYWNLLTQKLYKLEEKKIWTYLLSGNHDENASGVSAITPIKNMNFNFIKVIDEMEAIEFENCKIIFIPHLVKNKVCQKSEDDRPWEEFIKDYITDFIVDNCHSKKDNYIMGHLHYIGAVNGYEEKIIKGGINFFTDIKKSKIKRIFLGHIHKQQSIGEKVFYPGSLIRNDFSERDEDKGFIDYNFKTDEMEIIPVETTEYKQIEIDLMTKNSVDLNEIKIEKSVKGKVVKIVFNIAEKNRKLIDINDVLNVFSKYCYIQKYEINYLKSIRLDVETKDYNPKEFYKKYVDENIKNVTQRKRIMKDGLDIISQVTEEAK